MHRALATWFYGPLATEEAREAREALAALRETTGPAFTEATARVAGLSLAEGAVWALSEGE